MPTWTEPGRKTTTEEKVAFWSCRRGAGDLLRELAKLVLRRLRALEHDALVAVPADQLEGAGADRHAGYITGQNILLDGGAFRSSI